MSDVSGVGSVNDGGRWVMFPMTKKTGVVVDKKNGVWSMMFLVMFSFVLLKKTKTILTSLTSLASLTLFTSLTSFAWLASLTLRMRKMKWEWQKNPVFFFKSPKQKKMQDWNRPSSLTSSYHRQHPTLRTLFTYSTSLAFVSLISLTSYHFISLTSLLAFPSITLLTSLS